MLPKMRTELTTAEVNHLRRLLGWSRCEAGPAPDELVQTVQKIAPQIQDVSNEGKARLVQWHQEVSNVPQYVRAALKALAKVVERHDEAEKARGAGDVVCWRHPAPCAAVPAVPTSPTVTLKIGA